MPRFFSLDEANQVLDQIRPLIGEILTIRQEILDKQPEIWPVVEKAAGNGGSKAATLVEKQFGKLDSLVHRILDTGAILKDANLGLVDFPSLRDGREVYLCWKYGEDEIRFWHDVDAGMAGRQLIE